MGYELAVAICAVFISLVSLATSIFFNVGARKHDRKSVLPYPYLERGDYENEIRVRLHNKGTGPMLVMSADATHFDSHGGSDGIGPLVDLIPDELRDKLVFADFARFTEERAILPGESTDLLLLAMDEEQNEEHDQAEGLERATALRRFLRDCVIEVEYTDVYRTWFPPYVADCSWFGRLLEA